MLTVISPAKRLDFGPAPLPVAPTRPAFQDDAVALSRLAGALDVDGLRKLMKISEALAVNAQGWFRAFQADPDADSVKPAALAFAGDTYAGLEAASLDADEMAYAQDHLRILSGLYGLLRPMDLIQPYRLEMGSRLASARGKSLYDWWGDRLARALEEQARHVQADIVVNCASVEYFTALRPDALRLRIITPVFMEDRNGQARIVSFYAKKARGAMARFIIQNRIDRIEGLRDFDLGGYRYQPEMSEGNRLVFLRAGDGG
ncbi:MAG: peroxide stress protein YaaA [Paracoccaceae bacterium]|nr:peroxide stress protein YaaA [Paracoccaceae bacterium]